MKPFPFYHQPDAMDCNPTCLLSDKFFCQMQPENFNKSDSQAYNLDIATKKFRFLIKYVKKQYAKYTSE